MTDTAVRPADDAGEHRFLPQNEQRSALLRLALIIAGVALVSAFAGVGSTVLVVVAIIAIIVFHEAGHLLVAKACKIKVTEYFIGFGPRLWSIRRGETEYGIKALPLGGYCRIIGMNNLEEVDPADEPRTYRQHPVWQRILVALGGPATHFLVAFGLLFAMFFWTGDNGNIISTIPADNPIMAIDGLTTGQSPAQAAGVKVGDRIVAVDGHRFANFTQVSAFLSSHPGQQVTLEVNRGGAVLTLHATLTDLSKVRVAGKDAPPPAAKPKGFLGVEVSGVVHLGLASALGHSVTGIGSVLVANVDSIPSAVANTVHQLGNSASANKPSTAVRFSSPVNIVRIAHQATQAGLGEVLFLLADISIFVGIFNLLPMPPLDGGHIAVALYE
ncbi:MAG TPA: M50 family metallopeptidase, partial [Acidimicrobiales bacterium]|nr:M50 family metallopeptidase [Acidimicrobiales bacterium]